MTGSEPLPSPEELRDQFGKYRSREVRRRFDRRYPRGTRPTPTEATADVTSPEENP